VDPARVIALVQRQPGQYRLDGSHRVRFGCEAEDEADRLKVAGKLLTALGAP